LTVFARGPGCAPILNQQVESLPADGAAFAELGEVLGACSSGT
jgi:hypothetical protein